MKKLALIFSLALVTWFLSYNIDFIDKKQTVNPLLGDISFVSKFGYKPDATTNNDLRIKTHLVYVENLLRQKDVSHLSTELQNNRNHNLDLLHTYWQAGTFPKNYDYADQRKPCFIDRDGTICAVGYLIEQTTSREIVNSINCKHQYDELLAMNDQTVDSWVLTSGLSKEECALIQPAYGPTPVNTYNHITPAYAISSSVIGGINLSLNTLNGLQMVKGAPARAVPIMGLLSGAGQIVLGSAMFPKEQVGWNGPNYTNESQKTLSMVNIGLGTTTFILSACNLITQRKPKNKLTTWNLCSYPTQDNTGLAFSLTRRF